MSRSRSHQNTPRTSHRPSVSFWRDPEGTSPLTFAGACCVLVAGMLLGGGGGWFGDTTVQLVALPLGVLAVMEWRRNRLGALDVAALVLIAGIGLLGCIQLMPLPEGLWASLPGRGDLLANQHALGIAGVRHTVSLNPHATERALVWTLPALAMFLAARWMSIRQQRVLLLVLFSTTLLLIVIGALNGSAAPSDALATANEAIAQANVALSTSVSPAPSGTAATDPYASAFGMFTNRNHFATLLAMAIPFVVASALMAWVKRGERKESATWIRWASVMGLVLFGMLVGMIQTKSRAALVLGPLVLVCSWGLFRNMRVKRPVMIAAAAMAVLAVLAALEFAGSDTINRLDRNASSDLRWKIHATTLEAARHFGPMGTGLGTFVEVYQQVTPVEGYLPAYVNRAHGDYHELWLETGVPGAILIGGFLLWWMRSSWVVWSASSGSLQASLVGRAASIALLMPLLHSYLDYPLRKTAILVIFGMCAAFLRVSSGTEAVRTRRNSAPGRTPVSGRREPADPPLPSAGDA